MSAKFPALLVKWVSPFWNLRLWLLAPTVAMTHVPAQHDFTRGMPLTEDGVTYAAKIDKSEARIDWTRPAAEVCRLLTSSPWPAARGS